MKGKARGVLAEIRLIRNEGGCIYGQDGCRVKPMKYVNGDNRPTWRNGRCDYGEQEKRVGIYARLAMH